MPMITEMIMLDEQDVAQMLGIAIPTLRKWRMQSKQRGTQVGPPARKAGRRIKYLKTELVAYVEGLPVVGREVR